MIELTSSFANFVSNSALIIGLTIIAIGMPYLLGSLIGLIVERFLEVGRGLGE